MTEQERTVLAEQLFAVVFSLRPDDGDAGQAWALSTASTALARAILASTGPQGNPEALLALAQDQIRLIVTNTQAKFFRDKLTAAPRPA